MSFGGVCYVIPLHCNLTIQTLKPKTIFMAKLTNTIATLLAGAAVGVAVGYLLATDKEKRQEDLEKLKKGIDNLKEKMSKKAEDHVEDIYHT